jgi:hypothetical protein
MFSSASQVVLRSWADDVANTAPALECPRSGHLEAARDLLHGVASEGGHG